MIKYIIIGLFLIMCILAIFICYSALVVGNNADDIMHELMDEYNKNRRDDDDR